MSSTSKSFEKQAGMMLLEALIAILIFSLGILAIVGMQATAIKQVRDAKYRSIAGMLANQLLGQMWISVDRSALPPGVSDEMRSADQTAALKAKFESSGTGYAKWKDSVDKALPISTSPAPFVNVAPNTNGKASTVTIRIQWRAPTDAQAAAPHKYDVVANIK